MKAMIYLKPTTGFKVMVVTYDDGNHLDEIYEVRLNPMFGEFDFIKQPTFNKQQKRSVNYYIKTNYVLHDTIEKIKDFKPVIEIIKPIVKERDLYGYIID